MNYNTQNAKIASITEKTLIVGIDVGSETHYARAFNWRNYEYSKKPFAFSNDEAGFASFKAWIDNDLAIHFYEKNGFVKKRQYATSEGRKMLEYRYRKSGNHK